MTGLYLNYTAWQKAKVQLQEIEQWKFQCMSSPLFFFLKTQQFSNHHYKEHVMKLYTTVFRSVQHGSCRMLKIVAKPQPNKYHLGYSFLLKLVVVSSKYNCGWFFASFTRLHGTYHTTFTVAEGWNAHAALCLPSLQTQTGFISAVSWSCDIYLGTRHIL